MNHIPDTYTAFLREDGLNGARIGVVREPMDPKADPSSEDYKRVREVIDQAIDDLTSLDAAVVDPVTVPKLTLADPTYVSDNFLTERAMDEYLAEHSNAPIKTLQEILLTGKVTPCAPEV